MASTMTVSPHRGNPSVQALQSLSPYLDLYTNSPSTLRDDAPTLATARPGHPPLTTSDSHPEPSHRFLGSAGYGARHINDKAPFSLWDKETHSFVHPTRDQFRWIEDTYQASIINIQQPFMVIITASPPQPSTLTVACMAAIFIPPGTPGHLEIFGNTTYASPRIPDPCKDLEWPKFSNPSKFQITQILTALSRLVNAKAVFFLPTHSVIELDHNDGRSYMPASLPGKVGNRSTVYHHSHEPFMEAMQSFNRDLAIDPANFAQLLPSGASLLQDSTDYLVRSPGILTPGVRVSPGLFTADGSPATSSKATTAGVFLRNGTQTRLSVAHHGFSNTREVYHPDPSKHQLGIIEEVFPELDVALVKLDPSFQTKISNNPYFQAETPRRLAEYSEIEQGGWYELDGMSTGLMELMSMGTIARRPERPLGNHDLPFSRWTINSVARVFGAANDTMRDGVCGSAITKIDSGEVVGFFRLGSAGWCEFATLDDLIALGWQVHF